MIVISIFVTNLEYINMFENTIANGIVNIIYGIIVIVMVGLFYNEEKKWIETNSKFYSFLIKVLLALGVVSCFYHIGYATGQIIAVI